MNQPKCYFGIALLLSVVFLPMSVASPPDSLAIQLQQQVADMSAQQQVLHASLDSLRAEVEIIPKTKAFFDDPLKAVLSILGAVALIFWLAWFLLKKSIKKIVEDNYEGMIKKEVKSIIQEGVKQYEESSSLKRRKKILVITSKGEGRTAFVARFFKNMEFEQYHIQPVEKYLPVEYDYDVVFADNEDGALSQQEIEKFIMNKSGTVLFYYGGGPQNNWKDFSKIGDRLNLATSKAQIYGNLISTLKYHDLKNPKL